MQRSATTLSGLSTEGHSCGCHLCTTHLNSTADQVYPPPWHWHSLMPPDLSKRSSRILHIPIPSSIHLTCRPTVDRADEDSGPPLVSCGGWHQEVGGGRYSDFCVLWGGASEDGTCWGMSRWCLWHCKWCPVRQKHQRVCTDDYNVVVVFFSWFILLIISFGTAESLQTLTPSLSCSCCTVNLNCGVSQASQTALCVPVCLEGFFFLLPACAFCLSVWQRYQ